MRLTIAITALLGLTLGCEGVISGTNGPAPRCGRSTCGATGELAASTAFPRLTHAQWENTVNDLFRLDALPNLSGSFEPDTRLSFFDNNTRALRVSDDLWLDYQAGAESLAEQVTVNPTALARFLPPGLTGDSTARAEQFVREFGRRAHRRELTSDEVAAYATLFEEGDTHHPEMSSFDAGVRMVVEAMLQSPYFLYRTELGTQELAGRVELGDFEVASRLSYFLWNSMPDDTLFGAAAGGTLRTPEQIQTQARRMLDDPRGGLLPERFHAQLLNWDLYDGLNKDPEQYPNAYDGMDDDLYEEARRFVDYVVTEANGDLAELLTAPYTFVNDGLASIYGLDGAFDGLFVRADLSGDARGGLLTQLGFLASHGGLTGAIHRGVFVNHRLLCTELPPPPDNLPPIPADDGQMLTARERIDQHTGPGTCGAGCHGTYINPVGFAFEQFDGLGQYRTTDNGLPVDASASFEFLEGEQSYNGAREFAERSTESLQTHDCYAKHWLEFALGRGTAGADLFMIENLGDASIEGLPIQELIIELVKSEQFRTRNVGDL